nr:chemotaxis-specific protein-glutamate methyltransferase CheB [uncultured Sphingomonas sp.]
MRATSASIRTGQSGPGAPSGNPIRLMLVDDSVVARAVLARMIEADRAFDIVAVAGTAEHAIEALKHIDVDVIVLDLEMPGEGGLKSIPKIIEAAKGAQVMIVSSLAEEGAEQTVAALALGAADTLPKPGTGRFNGRFSEVLLDRLRALGRQGPAATHPPVRVGGTPVALRSPVDSALSLLAIGASTGGIHALATFFGALPERINVPILVTQHLPPAFMSVFARQLSAASGREAVVADDGMTLVPDRIVIAPGDKHLTVDRYGDRLVVRLSGMKVSSGCLPSVDPMLASAAEVLGAGVLGVILTGMGRDGLEGARRLIASGGAVMAQDERSSAVWGMPRAVAEAGLTCAVLPPEALARRVAVRATEVSCK